MWDAHRMSRLPSRAALLLPLLLIALIAPARAEDPGAPPPLSDLYRRVARLDVPVEEISGMTALPGAPEGERHFLARETKESATSATPPRALSRPVWLGQAASRSAVPLTMAKHVPPAC